MPVRQAGGVVLLGDRVVLRRTARGEYLFPKGHLEAGETLQQAAIREVAEETGLAAEVVRRLGVISFTYQGEQYRVTFYLMRAIGELPEWRDHLARDTVAVPPEQARELLSFESYRRLWGRARSTPESPPPAS